MSRYIDADFEIAHYTSMTTNPTPDVTEKDKRNSLVILDALRMAKSIDIEPKRGEWIEINKEVISVPIKWSEADKRKPIYKVKFRCSECGFQKSFIDWHTAQYNFCPNCGCAMTKE